MEARTCNRCGETRPVDDFPWASKKRGQRRGICRDCERLRQREQHDKHKAKYAKTKHSYYLAHKEQWLEANRRRRLENPEAVKAYNDAYYAEHREEICAAKRAQRRLNNKYKNLSKGQQLELFNVNMPLVKHITKRYKCHEYMRDDMLQAGYEGLWKGILDLDKYKPNKATLSTWFGWYIMRHISDFTYSAANNSGLSAGPYAIKNKMKKYDYEEPADEADKRLLTTAVYIDADLDKEDADAKTFSEIIGVEDEHYDGLTESVNKLLEGLGKKHRDVLVRNFGIGCEPETLRDIANDYGVTGETVGNWVKRALETIRDMPGSSSLRAYL